MLVTEHFYPQLYVVEQRMVLVTGPNDVFEADGDLSVAAVLPRSLDYRRERDVFAAGATALDSDLPEHRLRISLALNLFHS